MLGGVMLISMVFEKTDKSHLWYLVKLPLAFLHSGHTFSGFSSHPLKRLSTPLPLIHITQPPQHEAFFFSPLLWASDLNRFFSSQSAVLFSTLIERLFALSALSCAWSLKGDETSVWTEINLLTSTSSVSPDFESPSSPLLWTFHWTLTRFSVLTCVGEAFEKVSRAYNIWHITICFSELNKEVHISKHTSLRIHLKSDYTVLWVAFESSRQLGIMGVIDEVALTFSNSSATDDCTQECLEDSAYTSVET